MTHKLLQIFIALTLFEIAATFCFGGSGGGSSCCGGGGGCGGGCGRKKRSVEEPMFNGIISNDSDMLCNSPEMKQLILQNMRTNATESSRSVQSALEEHDMHRYVVVCSESPFHYTVKHDSAYCGARNGNHYCQAFAI